MCDDGVESKFVLKSESINVDFPKPVSPILNTRMSNVINFKMVFVIRSLLRQCYTSKDALPMHMILNVKPAATLWFTS